MPLALIAILNYEHIIAVDGKIPYDIPEDRAWFRMCTLGHRVIIGRCTYETLDVPLDGRRVFVVTKNLDYTTHDDATVVYNPRHAIVSDELVFCAGGEQLYSQLWREADYLYLTWVDQVLRLGNIRQYFPQVNWSKWSRIMHSQSLTYTNVRYTIHKRKA